MSGISPVGSGASISSSYNLKVATGNIAAWAGIAGEGINGAIKLTKNAAEEYSAAGKVGWAFQAARQAKALFIIIVYKGKNGPVFQEVARAVNLGQKQEKGVD